MPTECPAQSVATLAAMNSARASQVKVTGPSMTAASVMAAVQIDLAGVQTTVPATASLSASEIMRVVERQVMARFLGLIVA